MGALLAVRVADRVNGLVAGVLAFEVAAVILLGPGGVTLGPAITAGKAFRGPGAVERANLPGPGGEQDQLRAAARTSMHGNPYAVIWAQQPFYYDYTGAISAS